jgi:hypothetical protein
MTTETSHPTFEQLLDYVEGTLTPALRKPVQQHLDAGCHACRANIIWLNHTVNLIGQDEWKEPPAALQTAARQAFHHRSRPHIPGLISRFQNSKSKFQNPKTPRRFRPQPRLIFGGYAILLVFLLSGLLFLLEPALVPARASSSVDLKGNVEIQPQGEDEWQPAPTAYNPRSGDLFRTKNASTATLSFFGRTVTKLDANTAVAVTALRNSASSGDAFVVLHQWEGQTENSVGLESYNESQLIIQTPAVLITGETASFITNVARNGDTTIFVRQGQVKVTAEGVTTTITAGEAARILVGVPPVTIALNTTPTPSPTPSPTPLSTAVPPTFTPDSPAADSPPASTVPAIPPTYPPAAPNPGHNSSAAPGRRGGRGGGPPPAPGRPRGAASQPGQRQPQSTRPRKYAPRAGQQRQPPRSGQ